LPPLVLLSVDHSIMAWKETCRLGTTSFFYGRVRLV
jgi:hypothetical protein